MTNYVRAATHLTNIDECLPRISVQESGTVVLCFGDLSLFVWSGVDGVKALRDALNAYVVESSNAL